jgi:tetratricopeptide (TPR) repeat protein
MPPPGARAVRRQAAGYPHRLAALQAAQLLEWFVGGPTGQASPEAAELRRTCQLNAALCLLALGRPADAVAECDAVLRRHPAERKALYRRGLGRLALADAAAAAPDLRAALELCAAALAPPPPGPRPPGPPRPRLGALSGSS